MTQYKTRLGIAIATVAIFANSFAGIAHAGTNITITGNGADSASGVSVNNTQSTSVNQSNNANFTNNVSGNANTGDNDANKNTGGSVKVQTGDATVNNTVSNQANQNFANVSCNCNQGDTFIKVAGNGADSSNAVSLDKSNSTNVGQNNNANFNNNVGGNAKTGNNDANKNTGGNVSVETGDASVNNHVSNWANGNSANVGGNGGNGGDVSLLIAGNGADSSNGIEISDNGSASVYQSNNADFNNNVKGYANSGDNDANENTGGNVEVETGDASVNTSVDNQANFNWADLNCGCTVNGGLTATVDGNGADSSNAIEGNFDGNQTAAQSNSADINNLIDCIFAKTGNNDANDNDGGAHGDPSVMTGDAGVNSSVSNSANLNGLGGDQPEWPNWDMGNGVHVTVNFNLNDLLASLGL